MWDIGKRPLTTIDVFPGTPSGADLLPLHLLHTLAAQVSLRLGDPDMRYLSATESPWVGKVTASATGNALMIRQVLTLQDMLLNLQKPKNELPDGLVVCEFSGYSSLLLSHIITRAADLHIPGLVVPLFGEGGVNVTIPQVIEFARRTDGWGTASNAILPHRVVANDLAEILLPQIKA